MGGVRLGGIAHIVACSPPFTAYDGPLGVGDPQVYVACTDDPPGDATRYTDFAGYVDSDENFNPVISPDGTKVLFEVLSPSTNFREIWVTDAIAGSTPTQLVASGSQYRTHPYWHPDSDTFVYVQGTGGGVMEGDIAKDTVSSPGSPTILKTHAGGGGGYRPQFNFDGTRVAYIWTAGSDPQIRCMDDDGSNDGLVDDTISGYDSNEPPQFGWANTQNLIAFQDGLTPQDTWIIDDTGGGKTQLDANGDAAGATSLVSLYPFPADDSFVVITANIGSGFYNVFRAELDGSDTTQLGTTGPVLLSPMRGALVYQGRIWFISDNEDEGNRGRISFMSLSGAGQTVVLDTDLGTGDAILPFVGGDGWYFN